MTSCDYGENGSNLICLSNDLKKLLFDDQYSDWTLICEGEKIPCHRNLIASRYLTCMGTFLDDGTKRKLGC